MNEPFQKYYILWTHIIKSKLNQKKILLSFPTKELKRIKWTLADEKNTCETFSSAFKESDSSMTSAAKRMLPLYVPSTFKYAFDPDIGSKESNKKRGRK